jgi:hypothetical protein
MFAGGSSSPPSLPLPGGKSLSTSPLAAFGRARARYLLVSGALTVLLLLFFVFGADDAAAPHRLGHALHSAKWSQWWHGSAKTPGEEEIPPLTVDEQVAGGPVAHLYDDRKWVNGSGRTDLSYDTPFNRDDLTLCEDECDAFFPGLWKEIDRSVKYFTEVVK